MLKEAKEKLEIAKEERHRRELQKKISSYNAILNKPKRFKKFVDGRIKEISTIRKGKKRPSREWRDYRSDAWRNTDEKFNKERYEQQIQQYEKIEKNALAVAFSTQLKGEEKEAELQDYLVSLKAITRELAALQHAIKQARKE